MINETKLLTGKWELLASPSHVYHSPERFDDRSTSLLTAIFSKNGLAHETPKQLFPVPGLMFHAMGGASVQTTSGAQNYSIRKIDMDSRIILANKCPTPVRAHR